MRRILLSLVLSAVALILAGCPKHKDVRDTETGSTAGGAAGSSSGGLNNGGLQEGQALNNGGAGAEGESGAEHVIYFDFDSSDIRADSRAIVDANARRLAADPKLKVRLEGNTDERGSREYNIGLGERRAQAVRSALMLQGVGDAQIATVSYGEERPAVSGADESAWSKNRRVEIVYGN